MGEDEPFGADGEGGVVRERTTGEESAPLIGVDELETPYWAEGYGSAATAGLRTLLRAAPRTAALVARWAWQVSKPLTLLAGIVQLLAGAVTAFGLLATANVFSLLLEEGPTPERVVAALPALALVVGAFALRGLLDAAVAAVAAALTPRIEQRAQDDLHAAMIEVELAAFDDADFTDLAQRAAGHGIHRVHIAARATGGLLASLVSMMAAVVTAGLLHPLLAPVVLLAAVPQGWASIRAAKLSYDSFVRMTSRMRRLDVTCDLITERRYAADVRALTAQDVLLAEHRRIATQLTVEAIAVEQPQDAGPARRPDAVRNRHRAGLRRARAAALHRGPAAGPGRRGRGRHANGLICSVGHGVRDEHPVRGGHLPRPVPHLRGGRA